MIESPSHTLVIKSAQKEIEKVEQFLKDIFEKYQLPIKCFNKVFLCVSEAVNNSIIHGNKQKVHKAIHVQVNYKKQTLDIVVTDEGEGFDINAIPDPTDSNYIKNESGRGIHIIKSLSVSLKHNEKGNSLQFQINCS